MKYLAKFTWVLILLGLALTTTGWALKLDDHQQADMCIMLGNSLVLVFGALALWKLVQWLNIDLRAPLVIIVSGLFVSLLSASSLAANATMPLAVTGAILASGGTLWLLLRLNRTLERPRPLRQRKHPA